MLLIPVFLPPAPLHPLTRAVLDDLGSAHPGTVAAAVQALQDAGRPQQLLRVGLLHPSERVRARCQALLQNAGWQDAGWSQ
ncbi:hypothetical protein EHF33_12370 [Deinococcus psychrotolerans]|uniref:Uncharacterized protein n=1 Tax=Deinococcus psychrotolerans TaxID=2489213 RepID=A0A3G8YP81_9DEIO|nr:hypothetical protein [Deinococcus psychrotolerans]AZI43441.1 hypothetical protein EHF33_12370 [Deinococcus psychrotolerans]